MAVNVVQLAAALRLGDGTSEPEEPILSILKRLCRVSDELVEKYAPDAPNSIKQEATIRLAGYLYDMPSAPSGDRYAAAWRNSGAASLVSGWVVRRVSEEVM